MSKIIYKVIYEKNVLETLKEISFYYADKGNLKLAEKVLDSIIFQLDTLDIMPFRYQQSEFSSNIRKMVLRKFPYIAYYTVINDEVRILELIHSSKNHDFLEDKYENF